LPASRPVCASTNAPPQIDTRRQPRACASRNACNSGGGTAAFLPRQPGMRPVGPRITVPVNNNCAPGRSDRVGPEPTEPGRPLGLGTSMARLRRRHEQQRDRRKRDVQCAGHADRYAQQHQGGWTELSFLRVGVAVELFKRIRGRERYGGHGVWLAALAVGSGMPVTRLERHRENRKGARSRLAGTNLTR